MAAFHSPLDTHQDVGHLLYSSLLVLGLDAASLEHKLKTPVNEKMFSRMSKRLGETLLHFLFVCLDREKAGKVFRDCWPLLDKKQESQFHKAAFEWYKSLQQSYRQPVPIVMAKTFMTPGGPKFLSTLLTLARVALHSTTAKTDPSRTLLHAPSHSRCPEQNRLTLRLLQAFKLAHKRNYAMEQNSRQGVLKNLQDKAKELCQRYRRLCVESDRATQELREAVCADEGLTQHQKETLTHAPLSTVQKEILDDMYRMNEDASKFWEPVEQFRQVEESTWKVLCPLLDGSAFLSHIDGSLYSPQVPEIVLKTHAGKINKELQGLYREDKLDLLSLVQYSNLALRCLLDTVRTSHGQAKPESSGKLKTQSGQVANLRETVGELSGRVTTLLPALLHSVTSSRLRAAATLPSLGKVGLVGKLDLCPPTPPLSLVNTPVAVKSSARHVPLQLTPGQKQLTTRLAEDSFSVTPSKLLNNKGIIQAAKKYPKADVHYSAAAHKEGTVSIVASEACKEVTEAGLTLDVLTVDSRCRHLRRKEQEQVLLQGHQEVPHRPKEKKCSIPTRYTNGSAARKTTEAPTRVMSEGMNLKGAGGLSKTGEEKGSDIPSCSSDVPEEGDHSLLDRLADNIGREITDGDDDSGVPDVTIHLSSDTVHNGSTFDSGCLEMTKDVDNLLDAIQEMNITPKYEKKDLPGKRMNHRDSETSSKKAGSQLLVRSPKVTLRSTHNTPKRQSTLAQGSHFQLMHMLGGKNSKHSPRTTLVKQEQLSRTLAYEEHDWNKRDSISDLQDRLSAVTQSPVRSNYSSGPPNLDVLDSPGSKYLTSRLPDDTQEGGDGNLEELRRCSKANLSLLVEMQQSSQAISTVKDNTCKTESKPRFISYVENLKSQISTTAEGSFISPSVSITQQESSTNSSRKDQTAATFPDNRSDFLKDFSRNCTALQTLLGFDEEVTLTGDSLAPGDHQVGEDSPLPAEVFVSGTDADHFLEAPRQQSSYLPKTSVFDTLTDSILGGESDVALLTNDKVQLEVRRESISSRRQSLAAKGRLSLGSTTASIPSPSFMLEECCNIMDESDSCLLSSSLEDLRC